MKSIDQYEMQPGQRVYDSQEVDALLMERAADYKKIVSERDMYRRYYEAIAVASIQQTPEAYAEVESAKMGIVLERRKE